MVAMVMTEALAALVALLVVANALQAWFWSRVVRETNRNGRALAETYATQTRAQLAVVAQARGVSPAVADPHTFAPSGVPYEATERSEGDDEKSRVIQLMQGARKLQAQHAAIIEQRRADHESVNRDIESVLGAGGSGNSGN